MALAALSAAPEMVSGVVWMNHQDHILQTYRAIYENGEYTDCILMLADGVLHASSTVLSMASALLERIFAGASLAASTGQLSVSIPDVSVEDMQQVLLFIHTGEVNLQPYQLSSFVETCSLLELRGIKGSDGSMMGLAISGTNIVTANPSTNESPLDTTATDDPQCLSELWFQDGSETELDADPPDPAVPAVHDQSHVPSAAEMGKIAVEMNAVATLENISNDDSLMAQESHLVGADESSMDGMERCSSQDDLKVSEYDERLEAAINAIVNDHLSYRQASQAYNIPKTVLWRRALRIIRTPKPFKPPAVRLQAMEAIKAGAKLLSISRQFDIPLSTLHRDKQRLFNDGMLPASVTVRQRKDGSDAEQRLLEAAQHSLNGTLSLRQASQAYSLPRTSIWRKVQALKDPTYVEETQKQLEQKEREKDADSKGEARAGR